MATVTHTLVAVGADDPTRGEVLLSHWNAAHTVTLGAETVTSLTTTQGTIAAAAPLYDASVTWNNGAVTFVGWKFAITSTASALASLPIKVTLGGTEIFTVDKFGGVNLNGSTKTPDGDPHISASNWLYLGGSNSQQMGIRTNECSMDVGIVLKWSGSVPGASNDAGLARSSAGVVEFNQGAAGGVGYVKTPGTTVASLKAAGTVGAGTRAFVTNATATTFASIVAGGGANGVPVYSDGTDWRIG